MIPTGIGIKIMTRGIALAVNQAVCEGSALCKTILVDSVPDFFQASAYAIGVYRAVEAFTDDPRKRLAASMALMAGLIIAGEAIPIIVQNRPPNIGNLTDIIAEGIGATTTLLSINKAATYSDDNI